jgi:demethylmenaquinone methyltransferase/2-methoxy-6-polyprenyl-1,4-benzoquinol methylase
VLRPAPLKFDETILSMAVTPYGTSDSKKQEIREMFNNIAPTYDLLNHALSANIDKIWRRKAIASLKTHNPRQVLDVATGTGDLAIAALALEPEKITGVDISEEMLRVGIEKIKKRGFSEIIDLQVGDSENLPFSENSFDAVTVAFGVRNFEDPSKGIREMNRVLKPGGQLVVLEFTNPRGYILKALYEFYFSKILPVLGKVISKDFSAYKYLPQSVAAFPQREEFTKMLLSSGFNHASFKELTFGIASLYIGVK